MGLWVWGGLVLGKGLKRVQVLRPFFLFTGFSGHVAHGLTWVAADGQKRARESRVPQKGNRGLQEQAGCSAREGRCVFA